MARIGAMVTPYIAQVRAYSTVSFFVLFLLLLLLFLIYLSLAYHRKDSSVTIMISTLADLLCVLIGPFGFCLDWSK